MFTQQQLDTAYASIPDDVRSVMKTMGVSRKILGIGEKNDLHIDQIGNLSELNEYLMIGLIKRDEFVGVLQRELGVDVAKATAVARDVNDEILADIRSALREKTEAPGAESGQTVNSKPQTAGTTSTPPVGPHPLRQLADLSSNEEREALLREIESPTATPISGRAVRPGLGVVQTANSKQQTVETATTSSPPEEPHPLRQLADLPLAGEGAVTATPEPLRTSPPPSPKVGEGVTAVTGAKPTSSRPSPPQGKEVATTAPTPAKPAVDPYREIPA